jgi:hypothetical protein
MKLIQSHPYYIKKKIGELNKFIFIMYQIEIYSSFENDSDLFVSHIMTVVEVYGITIYIHEDNSKNIYQNDDESPIIHLIKIKLNNGSILFLPTEQEDDIDKMNGDSGRFITKKPHVIDIERKYIVFIFCYTI